VSEVVSEDAQPVSLRARLDEPLSRWLWLVKWFLLIPHFILLFFLWIAFVVVTVIAFFAILFTGRYPRGLFNFNLGVLRWSWRVHYYSYSGLGTDRYPPFTLGPVPDYPAQFDVVYPEHLSRGLVLVKWWLLAIPHYLIVGVFVSASAVTFSGGHNGHGGQAGFGLIDLAVFFVGVALLFTGRYPRGLFDFVLGMDRWVARVGVYAALMTDRYPPFRLDQGGDEPGPEPAVPGGPTYGGATAEAPQPTPHGG